MRITKTLAGATAIALLATLVAAFGAQAMGPGRGPGPRSGAHAAGPATQQAGTVPAAEAAALRYMREEEKLARDVYVVLASSSGDQRFARIARSEQQHMNAVLRQLDRYGIEDPAAGMAPGVFRDASLQRLYDELVARGTTSRAAALEVGRTIERTDIADLDARLEDVATPSIARVFQHLRAASERHLAAFGG